MAPCRNRLIKRVSTWHVLRSRRTFQVLLLVLCLHFLCLRLFYQAKRDATLTAKVHSRANVGKTSGWPRSEIEYVDPQFCEGEAVCEECMDENPILRHVRLVNGTLELFGVDPSSSLVQRFAPEMTDLPGWPPVKIPIRFVRDAAIHPSTDCDRVLDDGPVLIDMPSHCSNAFHVHNDNIFKHLISAEMAGMSGKMDRFSLIQVHHRCKPSQLLLAWYSIFQETFQWRHSVQRERICVAHLQYSLLAFEMFKNHKLERNSPVVVTKTSRRIVDAFRRTVKSKLFPKLAVDQVDPTEVKGQLVLFLGRRSSNPRRDVLESDQLRLKEEFTKRGLEFVIIDKEEEYKDMLSLWKWLSKASIIIGPHGAGLANAIYARPGALLVELRTEYSRKVRFFEAMAAFAGQTHVNFDFSPYQGGSREIKLREITQFVTTVLQMFQDRELASVYSSSVYAPVFLE